MSKAALLKHVKVFDAVPDSNSIVIYEHIFTQPVKLAFSWNEDGYAGDIFCVYNLGKVYATVSGSFGSCSGCDEWEAMSSVSDANERIKQIAQSCEVYDNLKDIQATLKHPALIAAFAAFVKNPAAAKKAPKEKKPAKKPEPKPKKVAKAPSKSTPKKK
jgi:hypothetical protein